MRIAIDAMGGDDGPGTIIDGALVAARHWVGAIGLFVVFFWAVGTTITTGITYRQLVAPDELRSSVNVLGRMISWGGQPFGAAIGAVIASVADVHAAWVFAFVLMSTTAIFSALALRSARRFEVQSSPVR